MANAVAKNSLLLSLTSVHPVLQDIARSIIDQGLYTCDWDQQNVPRSSLIEIRVLQELLVSYRKLRQRFYETSGLLSGSVWDVTAPLDIGGKEPEFDAEALQLVWDKVSRTMETVTKRSSLNSTYTVLNEETRNSTYLADALLNFDNMPPKPDIDLPIANQRWREDILRTRIRSGHWPVFNALGMRVKNPNNETISNCLNRFEIHNDFSLFVTRSFCFRILLWLDFPDAMLRVVHRASRMQLSEIKSEIHNLPDTEFKRALSKLPIDRIDLPREKLVDQCMVELGQAKLQNGSILGLALMPFILPGCLFGWHEKDDIQSDRMLSSINVKGLSASILSDFATYFSTMDVSVSKGKTPFYAQRSKEDESILRTLESLMDKSTTGDPKRDWDRGDGEVRKQISEALPNENLNHLYRLWPMAFRRRKSKIQVQRNSL